MQCGLTGARAEVQTQSDGLQRRTSCSLARVKMLHRSSDLGSISYRSVRIQKGGKDGGALQAVTTYI